MKRLMAIAALALAPLGCVANQGDAPVRFLDARALTFNEATGCTGSDSLVISRGSLDVAGGEGYLLAMSVETNNTQQPIVINQEVFSGEGLGDIILDEIVYSYEFQASVTGVSVTLPADEEERLPLYRVLRPGTDPEGTYVFMNALGPKAIEALRTSIPVTTPLRSQGIVYSTLKLRGRLSGGQPVESNKFTFPISVENSGLTYCPAGQFPVGTCQIPGQDAAGCSGPPGGP